MRGVSQTERVNAQVRLAQKVESAVAEAMALSLWADYFSAATSPHLDFVCVTPYHYIDADLSKKIESEWPGAQVSYWQRSAAPQQD